MAYEIDDQSLADYLIKNERRRVSAPGRRARRLGRPDLGTPSLQPRPGLQAEKGSFGLGRQSFYPFDIPNLIGWYRSDRGVSTDQTGRLLAWQDLSFGGNPLLPIIGASTTRPLAVGNAWDGKPVVRFVHADAPPDALATSGFIQIAPQPTLSFFMVANFASLPSSNGAGWRLLAGGRDGGNRFTASVRNNAGAIVAAMGIPPNASHNGTHAINVGRNLFSAVFNGASSRVRVNQGADDALSLEAGNIDGWSIGGDSSSESTDGDIVEVLLYGRAVTLAEQQQIEQYLAAQWNVI